MWFRSWATVSGLPDLFGTAAYLNGHFYYGGVNTNLHAFSIANAAFVQTSQAPDTIGALDGTISISSNGANNGIAWVIDRGSNSLKAYDASNLANEVWTSAMAIGARTISSGTAANSPCRPSQTDTSFAERPMR